MIQNTAQVAKWPSFSLIIETENLSSAELEGLGRSLDSLAAQTISPSTANEVLILESGDVPREMIKHLCFQYPWLTVRAIDAEMDYYAAKMRSVALTTGEVTVFADSDCIYESDWLCNLLAPFAQEPDIQVVAGETTTSANSPYGLGVSLTYIFPRWSGRRPLRPTSSYFSIMWPFGGSSCWNILSPLISPFIEVIASFMPIPLNNRVLRSGGNPRHGPAMPHPMGGLISSGATCYWGTMGF